MKYQGRLLSYWRTFLDDVLKEGQMDDDPHLQPPLQLPEPEPPQPESAKVYASGRAMRKGLQPKSMIDTDSWVEDDYEHSDDDGMISKDGIALSITVFVNSATCPYTRIQVFAPPDNDGELQEPCMMEPRIHFDDETKC